MDRAAWQNDVDRHLRQDILPFWAHHAPDKENGGFIGGLTNDLRKTDDDRSLVLCARMLWTFSAAARHYGDDSYLSLARYAYETLLDRFFDPENGGFFWSTKADGQPAIDRKDTYGEAFAVYGLSEFARLTSESRPLELARQTLDLVEFHALDAVNGGYRQTFLRDWTPASVPPWTKSHNTHLHLLEAMSAYLRASDEPEIRSRQERLLGTIAEHIYQPAIGHLLEAFADDWQGKPEHYSYGHEIETAWLMTEAAAQLGGDWPERIRPLSLRLAENNLRLAVLPDGSFAEDGDDVEAKRLQRVWWIQAEAVVGFYDAFQLSGDERFEVASYRAWRFCIEHQFDSVHGDWFKELDPELRPVMAYRKIGPWECPYHHARMLMEMSERLAEQPHGLGAQTGENGS